MLSERAEFALGNDEAEARVFLYHDGSRRNRYAMCKRDKARSYNPPFCFWLVRIRLTVLIVFEYLDERVASQAGVVKYRLSDAVR